MASLACCLGVQRGVRVFGCSCLSLRKASHSAFLPVSPFIGLSLSSCSSLRTSDERSCSCYTLRYAPAHLAEPSAGLRLFALWRSCSSPCQPNASSADHHRYTVLAPRGLRPCQVDMTRVRGRGGFMRTLQDQVRSSQVRSSGAKIKTRHPKSCAGHLTGLGENPYNWFMVHRVCRDSVLRYTTSFMFPLTRLHVQSISSCHHLPPTN